MDELSFLPKLMLRALSTQHNNFSGLSLHLKA